MCNWRIQPDGIFKIPESKLSLVEQFVSSLGGKVEKIASRHSVHQVKIEGVMVTSDHGVAHRFQRLMQRFGGNVRLRQAEDSKRGTSGYRQVVTR